VRGSGLPARLAAAAVVLCALALVGLAARSGRTETVTPLVTASETPSYSPAPTGPYKELEPEPAGDTADTSGAEMPDILVVAIWLAILGLAASAAMLWVLAIRPRLGLPGRAAPREVAGAAPASDAVDPARLAAAVDAGLRELADGGPGEGVVACWVQLERAAADAGTHRSQPDTPSELAGRLIDRHDVSPVPLLRLADLYREARYSRHVLPESARTEARAALEQIAAELAATPAGSRRTAP
jgi:Domain of unknown function (DUF4129)